LSSSITSCPSLYRQADQCFIAESSIAKLSIASHLLQAVQRSIVEPSIASRRPSQALHRGITEPSIATSPSRPAPYRRAVQRFIAELSIVVPSIAEPSIFSRPALYSQAIHRKPSSIASCTSRHRRAVQRFVAAVITSHCPAICCTVHHLPTPRHCPSFINIKSFQRFIPEQPTILLQSCPSPSRPLLSHPFLAVQWFIAEPSIASRCPLQAVHRDNAEPSSWPCHQLPSCVLG
jgi:hypothetical protein